MRKGKISTISDEEFKELIMSSNNVTEAARKIGYKKVSGGTYRIFREKIELLKIDTSHFNFHPRNLNYSFNEIFTKNSTYKGTLRNIVLKKKLIPYECAICGLPPEWNGKPLTLTLDHINGDHYDNRLENLRFLCPHCDQQQDTFCGKNKKKYYDPIVVKKIYRCAHCGTEITREAHYCPECASLKRRKVKRPSKEELIQLLLLYPFTTIGKKYSVTDNTIRKWCKSYNLPYKSSEIKAWRAKRTSAPQLS